MSLRQMLTRAERAVCAASSVNCSTAACGSRDSRAALSVNSENARVRWFLSLCKEDLPNDRPDGAMTHRSIVYDDKEFEFSHGFSGLHTKSYEHILAGDGFGLKDILPSIEIVSDIRRSKPLGLKGQYHPMLDKLKIKD